MLRLAPLRCEILKVSSFVDERECRDGGLGVGQESIRDVEALFTERHFMMSSQRKLMNGSYGQ
jgi:hypothetical protein